MEPKTLQVGEASGDVSVSPRPVCRQEQAGCFPSDEPAGAETQRGNRSATAARPSTSTTGGSPGMSRPYVMSEEQRFETSSKRPGPWDAPVR